MEGGKECKREKVRESARNHPLFRFFLIFFLHLSSEMVHNFFKISCPEEQGGLSQRWFARRMRRIDRRKGCSERKR